MSDYTKEQIDDADTYLRAFRPELSDKAKKRLWNVLHAYVLLGSETKTINGGRRVYDYDKVVDVVAFLRVLRRSDRGKVDDSVFSVAFENFKAQYPTFEAFEANWVPYPDSDSDSDDEE